MTPESAASILGIGVDADRAAIEAAYRRKARMSHPDRLAGGSASDVRKSADDFNRAGLARTALLDVLAARERAAVAPPTIPRPDPPTNRSAARVSTGRDRIIIGASAAIVLLVIGLVIALGALADTHHETNPGAVRGPSDSVPQDPLSGAVILPVKTVSTIEAHCQGANACWVWKIVAPRSCTGSVDVSFYAHANDAAPVEESTENIVVHANEPAYVSVSASEFAEHYARITQYDC